MLTKDAEGCNTCIKQYLSDSTVLYAKKTPETEEEKNQEIDNINSSI